MIVRNQSDGAVVMITQNDHAKLAGLFAAHWGNQTFERPRPYTSMMRAAQYHDGGWLRYETNPYLDTATGKSPSYQQVPNDTPQLAAYQWVIDMLTDIDSYTGLMVSKHRTGLWQNRYQTFTSPKGRLRERSGEVKAALQKFEAEQQEVKQTLGGGNSKFDNELWFNYRALQIYDLLSLYFCCDGYTDDEHFKEDLLAPIRLSYDSPEEADLRVAPNGAGAVRMEPYPFDVAPLTVSARARIVPPGTYASAEACLEAYHKASRKLLSFEISR
jgi:hypothetical protein